MDFLSGKKTYIMSIVTGLLGVFEATNQMMGWGITIPTYVWSIDAALFGGALRAGMNK